MQTFRRKIRKKLRLFFACDKINYLVQQFIPAIQECFAKNKFDEGSLEGGLLLAIEGELLTINSEFGGCDTADSYESVGKSHEVATGSLHTSTLLRLPPRQRLYLALVAATRHTCVVQEPYHYIATGMEYPTILRPELGGWD